LAGGQNRRWLIGLDDVTDPAEVRGWWPPERNSGRSGTVHNDRSTMRRTARQPFRSTTPGAGLVGTVSAGAFRSLYANDGSRYKILPGPLGQVGM